MCFVYGGHMNVYCAMGVICLCIVCAWCVSCVHMYIYVCMYVLCMCAWSIVYLLCCMYTCEA